MLAKAALGTAKGRPDLADRIRSILEQAEAAIRAEREKGK